MGGTRRPGWVAWVACGYGWPSWWLAEWMGRVPRGSELGARRPDGWHAALMKPRDRMMAGPEGFRAWAGADPSCGPAGRRGDTRALGPDTQHTDRGVVLKIGLNSNIHNVFNKIQSLSRIPALLYTL